MSRDGAGTYDLPAGQPVVTMTTISSSVFNTLMSDIATAMTNSLAADGQTPATARIPFANGISVSTDITSASTTFAIANSVVTTLNIGGAVTTLNIGAGAAATANLNFTTGIALNTDAVTTNKVTVTAFAGATTLLTLGGTGVTSVLAIPGTLQATGTTGALTVAGGAYIAKALNVAGLVTASAGLTVASGQTLTLTGATVAGAPTWSSSQAITLSTAAQPNVTSVGTLTSLTINGQTGVAATSGYLAVGAPSATGVNAADIAIPNNKYLRGTIAAGTSSIALIGLDVSNIIQINANGTATGTTVTGSLTAGAISGTTGAFSGTINQTISSGNAQGTISLADSGNRTVVLRSPDPLGTQAQVGTTTNHDLQFLRGGSVIGTISSTGLAVTGTLSSTGALTTNGGLQTFGANNSAGAGYRLVKVPNI